VLRRGDRVDEAIILAVEQTGVASTSALRRAPIPVDDDRRPAPFAGRWTLVA
jgi:hypothetical protein